MAQLVEVELEEESAIKLERFKRNPPERGQIGNQKNKDEHRVKNERRCVVGATRKGESQELAESYL